MCEQNVFFQTKFKVAWGQAFAALKPLFRPPQKWKRWLSFCSFSGSEFRTIPKSKKYLIELGLGQCMKLHSTMVFYSVCMHELRITSDTSMEVRDTVIPYGTHRGFSPLVYVGSTTVPNRFFKFACSVSVSRSLVSDYCVFFVQ